MEEKLKIEGSPFLYLSRRSGGVVGVEVQESQSAIKIRVDTDNPVGRVCIGGSGGPICIQRARVSERVQPVLLELSLDLGLGGLDSPSSKSVG